jgi:type IV pilus assembly protein PilE
MAKNKGFTLIEIMIVVAIVGLLAAIALPSYESYMVKTRRATAASCLLGLSQYMERFYTKNLSYAKDTADVDVALPSIADDTATQCQRDLQNWYDFALNTPDNFKPPSFNVAKQYVITATPKNSQLAKDKLCSTLAIDEKGTKIAAKPNAATTLYDLTSADERAAVQLCWK